MPTVSQLSSSELVASCPYGTGFGGPVELVTDINVLASQRVKYNQSFNEVLGSSADSGGMQLVTNWFDRVSDAGFKNDNVHVVNPGANPARVAVYIPGCGTQIQDVAAGGEQIFTCDKGFGGPVWVTSLDTPVLASQRIQYNSSFNEADSAPI